MIDLGLNGKRAVVAGAGYIPGRAGHGRKTSLRLAEAGATVACIDIDEGRANGIVAEIEAGGGKAFPVLADMTDRAQVERALEEAVSELGGLDVCVDIIGKANWGRADEITNEAWDWEIANNLTHVFYLFATAGRHMIGQGTGGAMVALASVDGINAAKYHVPYGAAKAGVIALVKGFADEYGHYGIRVNCVAPGNVGSGNEDQPEGEYDVNGINPLAAPRNFDIANAVLFLCSSLSERITGHTIPVDGGAVIHDLWRIAGDRVSQEFAPAD
jgi:NAD(P)-dependent dehydrogenase (short-subunit alcohol dehydrogenase family)